MLTLCRYPGESIIFQYEGRILELSYIKRVENNREYVFHIYLNNELEKEYHFKDNKFILNFIDDSIPFKFIIDSPKIPKVNERRITIDCPDYVLIRRKELKNFKRGVA